MTSPEWMSRTALLLGAERMERLRQSHVLVVGTYCKGIGASGISTIMRSPYALRPVTGLYGLCSAFLRRIFSASIAAIRSVVSSFVI